MRIVVLDTAASSGGALSILRDFYSYLVESGDTNEWIFLLSDAYVQETDRIKIRINREVKENWFKRIWFDVYRGKGYINALEPDVVLSLQNTLPKGIRAKKYLYVHQTIPFQREKSFSFFKKEERIYAIYQYVIGRRIKKSIQYADCVVVQTQWLKKAVEGICGPHTKIMKCVPTVKKQEFEQDAFSPFYFIYPAAPIIYKNHKVIEDACKILVDKGISGFRVDFTFDGNDHSGIYYVGTLERSDLFKRYTKGTLLFPSYIESFGYPLKEASGVGSIILASDREFAHELLEGYANAYYFDPFDSSQLAELMEKVMKGQIYPKLSSPQETSQEEGWQVLVRCICERSMQ